MASHRLTWLDVFTDVPLAGNPLAVVHDADDLDDRAMLSVARETGLSETSFVQAPTAPDADYRNRIWDLRRELRFAGHPSLGTAVAVAHAAGQADVNYVQQTPAGLQPVDVSLRNGAAKASMLQEPASFGSELPAGDVLGVVGLEVPDGDPSLPCQVVGTGVPQVLAPVGDPGALSRAAPDWPAIQDLLDAHEAIVLYVAFCDPESGRARARAFTHSADMGEDPATGSAAGPLGAYLRERRGVEAVTILQGEEMGRPSRLDVDMSGERVRVGGGAAVVMEATLRL